MEEARGSSRVRFCTLTRVRVCSRHVHNKDWAGAQRVAEGYDPESVCDVLVEQAKFCFQQNEFQKSEALLLRAQKPELAVQFYKVGVNSVVSESEVSEKMRV